MTINIEPNKIEKKARNFWNNIHFHPTDAIEDDWGKRILDKVASDKVAKTVRMYAMLEDIVTQNEKGELCYDFTLNDLRLDYMLSKGFRIFLSYNFLPPCISSDTEEKSTVCKQKTRYKGKYILTAPPKDYGLWEEICKKYTEHIVERYGIDEVSKWQLQCYNEPDIGAFFMNGATVSERCEEYCKIYDSFASGVTAVSDKIAIGGPALASEYEFFEGFLDHVKKNGVKLDFICFHSYGTTPRLLNNGTQKICVANHLTKIRDIIQMSHDRGLGTLPLIIDEWGAVTAGYYNGENCPELMFRETPAFASYFVKLFTMLDALDFPIEKIMICLSGQHEMVTDFSGFRNFFTLNFYQKPIYNAYVLAAKLGENKLALDRSEISKDVSIYPTVSDDGKISVLMAYASPFFDEIAPLDLTLKLKNAENYTAELTVIDEHHANAINAYRRLGCPDTPTDSERAEIAAAGELESEPLDIIHHSVTLHMKHNSVILLEFYPA